MNCDAKESIVRLRKLREELCEKQTTWKQAFAVKDMVVQQLKVMKQSALSPGSTKEEILEKIEELLILIDPDRRKELED
tara:strand:+ start:1483 stop:1719 length:237 start_codon:yes stop_codon:yes gene_type:complete